MIDRFFTECWKAAICLLLCGVIFVGVTVERRLEHMEARLAKATTTHAMLAQYTATIPVLSLGVGQ